MTKDDWYLFLSNKKINYQKHIISEASELMEFEPLEKDIKINQIKEIIIKQVWGHVFKIFLYKPPRISDLFSFIPFAGQTAITFDRILAFHKNHIKTFIETIEIPLINKQDETEIVQKIIFV